MKKAIPFFIFFSLINPSWGDYSSHSEIKDRDPLASAIAFLKTSAQQDKLLEGGELSHLWTGDLNTGRPIDGEAAEQLIEAAEEACGQACVYQGNEAVAEDSAQNDYPFRSEIKDRNPLASAIAFLKTSAQQEKLLEGGELSHLWAGDLNTGGPIDEEAADLLIEAAKEACGEACAL